MREKHKVKLEDSSTYLVFCHSMARVSMETTELITREVDYGKFAEASRIPSFFLTAGWLNFSNKCYYDTLARMGERKTAIVYEMLYYL